MAPDFPFGHTVGLRRLDGEIVDLSDEERSSREALTAELARLEREHADADELPEEVDQRLSELETVLEAFEMRPIIYDPNEIARAGLFVSVDSDGELRIERGYVRPEDEPPLEPVEGFDGDTIAADEPRSTPQHAVITIGASPAEPRSENDEDDSVMPLSERLIAELTAHRTLALRDALANDPDVAFTALLHTLCLGAFYGMSSGTCLEISAKSASFSMQAQGLVDSASARAIEARHQQWAKQLPQIHSGLWDALAAFDRNSQAMLFAHCASLAVNAVHEPWSPNPRRLACADILARAVHLDMAAVGWSPTVDNYLGRVPKARILEAVRQGKGESAAQLIGHLRKTDMAKEAERLLAGTRWLPEPLRAPDEPIADVVSNPGAEPLPAFLADSEEDGSDGQTPSDTEEAHSAAVAAE